MNTKVRIQTIDDFIEAMVANEDFDGILETDRMIAWVMKHFPGADIEDVDRLINGAILNCLEIGAGLVGR